MLDVIYDTLFNNKQYEQFDCDVAENQIIDYSENAIEFDYNGKHYTIKVIAED